MTIFLKKKLNCNLCECHVLTIWFYFFIESHNIKFAISKGALKAYVKKKHFQKKKRILLVTKTPSNTYQMLLIKYNYKKI